MITQANLLYTVNPNISCREEGPDGALLFNPDTDDVLVINITGALIWDILAEPHNLAEIVQALAEQCNNIPQDQVTQDVTTFIEQLSFREFIDTHVRNAA